MLKKKCQKCPILSLIFIDIFFFIQTAHNLTFTKFVKSVIYCALAYKAKYKLTLLNTNVLSPLSSSSGVGGRGRLGAPPGPITAPELDDDPK